MSAESAATPAASAWTLIARVTSLPVVHSAVDKMTGIYENTKSSSDYVKRTLESVEGSVALAAAAAKPLIQPFEPTLRGIDTFGCRQLDRLEETLPIIRKPTDEIVADSRKLVEDAVTQGKHRLEVLRDTNEKLVKDVVRAVVDERVKPRVEHLLTTTEKTVDFYLPNNASAASAADEAEVETLTRVQKLSTKVQRRLYSRAMTQIKDVQLRSQQSLESFKFTVDLIQYAQENIDLQAGRIRSTIAKGKASVESIGGIEDVRKSVAAASELVLSLSESAIGAAKHPRTSAALVADHVATRASAASAKLSSTAQAAYTRSVETVTPYTTAVTNAAQSAYTRSVDTAAPYTNALQSKAAPYVASLKASALPLAQSLQTHIQNATNAPAAVALKERAQPALASLQLAYTRLHKDLVDLAAVLKSARTTQPEEAAANAQAHAEVVRLAALLQEGLATLQHLTASISSQYTSTFSQLTALAQRAASFLPANRFFSFAAAAAAAAAPQNEEAASSIELEEVAAKAAPAAEFVDASERLSESEEDESNAQFEEAEEVDDEEEELEQDDDEEADDDEDAQDE
ncbi:hypothetical protein CAOG_05341 [Capsaspora owczarzaki ATCC 30864]|uniref:Uncharacterized protein n=1 Tax=Capsaspora owczarzaki (strain ATCC 30864) TaxID=595528 RepID=A0A0D2VTV3_CAPO3|nr:hypothetical protein CAOG_05341 [Capsaspora owczarzaki ATCC 30864]KJE94752.1 hypothetical protein CAOG_005341 [Capsaspora owczarzaki ATCC 30864]|eukprot:XP_004347026.1 hypothetical protein CAOG_05341 [Capsaspora owczarzaki ATCC 30864]